MGDKNKDDVTCNGSLNRFILSSASLRKRFRVCRVVESRKINLSISYWKGLEHSLPEFKSSQVKACFSCGFTKEFGNPEHSLCTVFVEMLLILACCWDNINLDLHLKTQRKILQKSCPDKRYSRKIKYSKKLKTSHCFIFTYTEWSNIFGKCWH